MPSPIRVRARQNFRLLAGHEKDPIEWSRTSRSCRKRVCLSAAPVLSCTTQFPLRVVPSWPNPWPVMPKGSNCRPIPPSTTDSGRDGKKDCHG